MISLDIQIKLLVFSFIYGFLFSIALDILYPLIRKTNKYYQIILSFILILLMAVIYFVAIDKIGYVIFHNLNKIQNTKCILMTTLQKL